MADKTNILSPEKRKAILNEALPRFDESYEGDRTEREKIADDQRFGDGEGQWPEQVRQQRKTDDDRIMVTVNKIRKKISRVKGENRQNKISMHAIPYDNKADPETAEIINGLLRTIENNSNAEDAYDWAEECILMCSRGWLKLNTEYIDKESFDQDPVIEWVENPLSVYFPPHCKDKIYLSDMRWAFETATMSEEEYKKKWPEAQLIDWNESAGKHKNWCDGTAKTYRIARYWRIIDGAPYTICLMPDKTVVKKEDVPEGVEPVMEREIADTVVESYVMSGADVLEGPHIWDGEHIPLIPVWGESMIVGDELRRYSYFRDAKEAQRMYNYHWSNMVEVVAQMPKAPYEVTDQMIEGHEAQWNLIKKKSMPYIKFNPDPRVGGGGPKRTEQYQYPVALAQLLQFCDQQIDDTMGSHEAFTGDKSNEKSGVAIQSRAEQGSITAFEFHDNLRRAVKWLGKLILEILPKKYSPGRVVRITNADGTTKQVVLGENEEDGTLYDFWIGRYDVTVKVGPSYKTQREQAADNMMRFMEVNREAASIISDLVVKNMDWPGADEISKRLKKMLPPGLAEEEGDEGTQPPLEGEMPLEGEVPAVGGAAPAEESPTLENIRIAQERAKLVGLKLENKKREMEIQNMHNSASPVLDLE